MKLTNNNKNIYKSDPLYIWLNPNTRQVAPLFQLQRLVGQCQLWRRANAFINYTVKHHTTRAFVNMLIANMECNFDIIMVRIFRWKENIWNLKMKCFGRTILPIYICKHDKINITSGQNNKPVKLQLDFFFFTDTILILKPTP